MIARRLAILATLIATTVAVVGTGTPSAPASAAPPAERVLLVADSVGLGSRGAFEAAFPPGWEANVIGTPALFVEDLESKHVRPTIAGAPRLVGDHVVVAGGYNYPYWDPERFDRSIDSMVRTLTDAGVKHVYWVTLREVKPRYISPAAWQQVQPYSWYFPTVNDHLRAALDRHDNLTLVDWAAVADRPGITYDAIHLNAEGARLYSDLIADAVAVNQTRPVDGSIVEIDVTDDPDTAAVALNLAATTTRNRGFFTAFDCAGAPPTVANVNYERGQTVSGAGIVPVGDDGTVCVLVETASQVIVDVFGEFGPDAALADAEPARVMDTRGGTRPGDGTSRHVPVAEPGTAAVALNVTGIRADGVGFITVHGCRDSPRTATVNLAPDGTTPNLIVIRPDDDGAVCVTTTGTSAHFTVDRFATFTDPDSVVAVRPDRLLDTRDTGRPGDSVVRFSLDGVDTGDGDHGGGGGGGDDPDGDVADPVTAVFFNLAIVRPDGDGYATAWPCDDRRPTTANANFVTGQVVSNFVTATPDADGDVCVWTSTSADVVIDVLGVTRRGFTGFTPRRTLDTRD